MSDETLSHPYPERPSLPTRNLWFGLTASLAAWLLLGTADLLVVWNECAHQQQYSGEGSYPAHRLFIFAISIVFLLLAVVAGTTSYYNWRALSHQQSLLNTNATDRREFMALVGVIVSITLGMGIVWLSIPPLLIQLCERAK